MIPNNLILISLDSSFYQLSVDSQFNLMFDQALFIFHRKSNIEFQGQLLSIYKLECDHFGLFRFLWFLALY